MFIDINCGLLDILINVVYEKELNKKLVKALLVSWQIERFQYTKMIE